VDATTIEVPAARPSELNLRFSDAGIVRELNNIASEIANNERGEHEHSRSWHFCRRRVLGRRDSTPRAAKDPAFFSRELFAELTSLRGDQGARRLSYPELIAPVPFLHGAIDIDTPEVMTRWRPFPFTPGFSPVERQHCIIEKPFKRFLENAPARSPG